MILVELSENAHQSAINVFIDIMKRIFINTQTKFKHHSGIALHEIIGSR